MAPGLDLEKGDKAARGKALQHAFATAEGKKAILNLNGGKKPNFKDAKVVEKLFVPVSEILKAQRSRTNSRTKVGDVGAGHISGAPDTMTAEAMNKKNQEFYHGKH